MTAIRFFGHLVQNTILFSLACAIVVMALPVLVVLCFAASIYESYDQARNPD